MSLTRRQFLQRTATAAASAWTLPALAQGPAPASRETLFSSGVASGDPWTDRVILWTRAAPPAVHRAAPLEVRWTVAADERLTRVVASGSAWAAAERDFTVKVDAGGLQPGRHYYYAFDAAGERSPVGRTRTLPESGVTRLRIAVVSCSNYPAGYFHVYRCLAGRDDLDAVVHLGDYIYEFANGEYGDGTGLDRVPDRPGEAITLDDYRARYATYRSDADLRDAHRMHPFIVVWDDHESANNAWPGGASNHQPGEGDWATRRAAAYRAFQEWLPVRELEPGRIRLYRRFGFGQLADLVMLDTRGFRDRPVTAAGAALADPHRTMLGAAQEAWLFEQLRASQRAGTRWRLVGQQVLFAPLTPPGMAPLNPDMWDGYPAARGRLLEGLASERIRDVAILTGDIHSAWAADLPRQPFDGYDASTGTGSSAVELVTPAISSPPLLTDPAVRSWAPLVKLVAPHVKYFDGDRNGYLVIDVTPQRIEAEFYFVTSVRARGAGESRGARLVCEHGSSRIVT